MWRVRCGSLVLALCLLALSWNQVHAAPRESEENLQQKIQREAKPIKKSKLQIHLARLHLEKALAAYGKGEEAQGRELLKLYVAQIEAAEETLRSSGRRASRQPQGFKELEIAARENAWRLSELKKRLRVESRGAVDEVLERAERVHEHVIRALFPSPRSSRVASAEVTG